MPDYDVRAGDTEPITFTVDLTGQDNLDNASSVKLYARKEGAPTNHVDGAACTTTTGSKDVEFDPVGAASGGGDAFPTGSEGVYQVYVKVTWSDGDLTRHPAARNRRWRVVETYES